MQLKFDIDSFPWESMEHKKAFMGMFLFLKNHDVDPRYDDVPAVLMGAFLVQKNQEAQQWWAETFGFQLGLLQKEILSLREQVESLKKN